MIRLVVSTLMAIGFSVAFLLLLSSTINDRQPTIAADVNLRLIQLVRLNKEDPIRKKQRIKPKKVKPQKQLPRPKVAMRKPQKPKMSSTDLELNQHLKMDLAANSVLGDASVSGFGEGAVNTNVLPLVRVHPVYPKRAKMIKAEGFVKLEFTITEFGDVKDIIVLESQPPSLFEHAAIRALTKWKFKPKEENNLPMAQRAMVQLNFELD